MASASCNHWDRATSIQRVIEIDLLNQLADIPFGDSEGCLPVKRECLWSCEISSKTFKDIRSLRRREVLLFVIRIRKKKLGSLVLRQAELVGQKVKKRPDINQILKHT